MSKVLVIAQHADGKLSPAVSKTVSAATAIGGEVVVAVFAETDPGRDRADPCVRA